MNEQMLLFHMAGVIFGAGSGFAIFVIGFISKSFKKEYKAEVLYKLFPLRYISYIGLIILISSGLVLSIPYKDSILYMPYFIAKLIFVFILVLASLYGFYQMRISKKKSPNIVLSNLAMAGKISFVLSLLIVSTAVFAFH